MLIIKHCLHVVVSQHLEWHYSDISRTFLMHHPLQETFQKRCLDKWKIASKHTSKHIPSKHIDRDNTRRKLCLLRYLSTNTPPPQESLLCTGCLWWGCMTLYNLTLWDRMDGLTHLGQSAQGGWMGCQLQQCVCRKGDMEKEIDLDQAKSSIYLLLSLKQCPWWCQCED